MTRASLPLRLSWLLLVPIFLCSGGLALRALNADVIWGDEYHSISDAGGAVFGPRTPADIWARVGERNPWHTPGYFILLSAWGGLAGWSVFALRLSSLLGGLLGVAWTYRLARRLLGKRTALYAAFVLALSAGYVYYMHEIRMYVWFVPITAFTLWAYLRVMHPRPGESAVPAVGGLALLGTGAVSALYTHYFAVLTLLALGVWHTLIAAARLMGRQGASAPAFWRRWWGVAAAMTTAGVLFIPWLTVLARVAGKVTEPDEVRGALDAWQTVRAVALLFGSGTPLLALAALALLPSREQTKTGHLTASSGAAFVGVIVAATFGWALLVNGWLQVLYYDSRVRYLFALWSPLALLLGLALDRLASSRHGFMRALAVVVLVVWAGAGVLYSVAWTRISPLLEGSDLSYPLHHVATGLSVSAQPGDVVVNVLPDAMPAWRYGGVADYYLLTPGWHFRIVERKWQPGEQATADRDTLATLDDQMRVWLAYTPTEPTGALAGFRTRLEGAYQQCAAPLTAPDYTAALYARDPVCCLSETDSPPLYDYGAGVRLRGVSVPDAANDAVPVTLAWSLAPDVPLNTYSVGVHILDTAGTLVAQTDTGLTVQAFACARHTVDTAALAPGTYTVSIVVYRWATGERLGAFDAGALTLR